LSTLKTDAIVAVSTNGDLSLDGLGTGGVSIASTLKMTKGGDISSASPLVIDTDGNYFDVTGTTNFAAMTVESGNFFMLQFDGALTITHGSGIELPGAADLTTATGDRLICYATAANTVEVMSVETEAAAAAGTTQVVYAENTTGYSTTSTSYVSAGPAISLTDVVSGKGVIITVNLHWTCSADDVRIFFEVRRGTTSILQTNMEAHGHSLSEINGSDEEIWPMSFSLRDTGHGGGSVTYNLYWYVDASTGYLGRNNDNNQHFATTMIAIEQP
jgi:hypothetical protein